MKQKKDAEFDEFANNYEQVHQKTISLSGEESKYFTELKIKIISTYLQRRNITLSSILDYGCGTGRAYYPIQNAFLSIQYYGVDPSRESIEVAKKESTPHLTKQNASSTISSSSLLSPSSPQSPPSSTFPPPIYTTLAPSTILPTVDGCMCAVVAHHIPVAQHQETFTKIYDSLTPGGYLFLFEHNPHNPLTRKVVRDCPFDKGAILLKPSYAKKMLTACGFRIESLRYYFFYPKFLSFFRPTEKILQKIPLGAQYVIIAKKSII